MSGIGDFVCGALMGAIVCFFVTVSIAWPDIDDHIAAVCAYQGGEMKDDVCIKDGRVVEIDRKRLDRD